MVSAVTAGPFPSRGPQAGQHVHSPVVDLFATSCRSGPKRPRPPPACPVSAGSPSASNATSPPKRVPLPPDWAACSQAEPHRSGWNTRGDQCRQRRCKVARGEQVGTDISIDLTRVPPPQTADVLRGKLIVGQSPAWTEMDSAYKEVVVDDPVVTFGVVRRHDLLVPDMRRIAPDDKTNLFKQFTAEGGKWRLVRLDSSAGSCPHHGSCRLWNGEPAEKDAVVLIEDDRAD